MVKELIKQLAAAASESKQIIGGGSGHAMWRVIKDWVEAQSALIEANQVKIEQVFLPYAITAQGATLYEQIASNPHLIVGRN